MHTRARKQAAACLSALALREALVGNIVSIADAEGGTPVCCKLDLAEEVLVNLAIVARLANQGFNRLPFRPTFCCGYLRQECRASCAIFMPVAEINHEAMKPNVPVHPALRSLKTVDERNRAVKKRDFCLRYWLEALIPESTGKDCMR